MPSNSYKQKKVEAVRAFEVYAKSMLQEENPNLAHGKMLEDLISTNAVTLVDALEDAIILRHSKTQHNVSVWYSFLYSCVSTAMWSIIATTMFVWCLSVTSSKIKAALYVLFEAVTA